MRYSRRILITSRAKWQAVLAGLKDMRVDFARTPLELIVRTPRAEKTDSQRAKWHAMLGELAPQLGLTPAEAKLLIKRLHFGVTLRVVKLGGQEVPLEIVPASEDLDREQYGQLIDATERIAAEQGITLSNH